MASLQPVAPKALRDADALRVTWVVGAALLGVFLVALFGLRDFSFTDYEAETKPAIDQLVAGHLSGFLRQLPAYAGAVLLEAPFGVAGHALGGDADLWAWRAQAVPGMTVLLVLGVILGRHVALAIPGRSGTAWGSLTALLIAGAPFGLLAQQTGHPEELLVVGIAVSAVLLAARGNIVVAGGLVGVAAVAKPWAVIAIPVVLLAAHDRRTLGRAVLACAVAGALLSAPSMIGGNAAATKVTAHTSTTGIFKPDNVFWFAGALNPDWTPPGKSSTVQLFQADPGKAEWAQRLEPSWAARISHPAIVAFAVLLAGVFWRRRSRVGGREDLLLLLSTVCWWRCLLDTWSVHYYALGALVALAAWEASRGRPPLVAAVATTFAWTAFQILPASELTPDLHTALYLAWALPLGVGMVVRLLIPSAATSVARTVGESLAIRLPTLARFVAVEGSTSRS